MSNPYHKQLRSGFSRLRFPETMETEYQHHHQIELLPRVRLLAFTAIAMMLIYSAMDWAVFSDNALLYSLSIRLGLDIPIFILLLYVSYRFAATRFFYPMYLMTYIVTGFSILFILYICKVFDIYLPYEGFYLWLMFGYFLLGLPFYACVISSWAVTFCYLFMENALLLDNSPQLYSHFFLISANMVGTIGAYLLEHLSRSNFLHIRETELARVSAENDLDERTKFIAAASHDLRQPIHAMGLMIDQLKNGQSINKTSAQLASAHLQLNELLNSLLDISKLNIGLITARKTNYSLDLLNAIIPNDPLIQVNIPNQLWVKTDGILLGRVVNNLVNNALRHSNAKHIYVAAIEKDKKLFLSIMDDGRGIAKELQINMFKAYHRGQDSHQGLGLGLAIVRELCELMGHELTFKSELNKGCEFTIELQKSEPELAAEISSKQNLGGTVFVIENDKEQRKHIKQLLEQWGYSVITPTSLHELTLPSTIVHAIIADYNLAHNSISGFSWIKEFRRHGMNIPAMILSASKDSQLPESSVLLGAQFMEKPATPISIKLWLQKYIRE